MSRVPPNGATVSEEPELLQIRQWSHPWLIHGFGTRQSEKWTHRAGRTWVHQIHSGTVHRATEAGYVADGDALISDVPGLLLEVRTADCLPVLLVDPVRRVVAAAHAGWRGTVAGIAARTAAQMVAEFGCRWGDLQAALGPSIGPCCFEVGPEVAAQFDDSCVVQAAAEESTNSTQQRVKVDLHRANMTQLLDAGLSPGAIFQVAPCTMCHPGQFHSFRRDREQSGRLVSGIGILDPAA
jgi:YfiH family protein